MARKTLSDRGIAALKPRPKLYTYGDPQLPGLAIRVMPSGSKSYVVIARDPNGKQIWQSIGNATHMGIEQARGVARGVIAAIKSGGDRGGPETFQKVAETWLKRHVKKEGNKKNEPPLRTERDICRVINNHILPAWSGRDFTSIKRSDVADLLDAIEDGAGPVAADKALAHISKLCNWYATRHDDYSSPIVRGMRRSNPKDRAGTRLLTDDELRQIWKQAEADGMFGAFVRMLLLTAQRREKVATMRWQDLTGDLWTIPAEEREKGNAGELVLPQQAVSILDALPHFASSPYVFTTGRSYFRGYSKAKAAFDAKVKIAPWWLHDLRRTARSLMARAGIAPLIAELTLGHVQKGIAATYDRHSYFDEKRHALAALAALLANILSPRTT
jgi:integrase